MLDCKKTTLESITIIQTQLPHEFDELLRWFSESLNDLVFGWLNCRDNEDERHAKAVLLKELISIFENAQKSIKTIESNESIINKDLFQ